MSSTQKTVQKVTLWSAYFFIITAVNLLFGASLQFFNATGALYVQSLGGNATYAGTMLTVFTVSATVMRIASGRFLDKKGRCIVIAVGAAIFGAGSLSFAIPVLPWLPFARLIQGIGYSMVTTGVTVAITDVIPKQRLGEGIGYFGLVSPLSTAMGPVVALKLCADGNYARVFIVAAIAIFFGGALTFFTNYEKNVKFRERIRAMEALAPAPAAPAAAPAAKPAATGEKKSLIWTYFEKSALKPTFISLLMSLPNGAIVAFLVLYAKSIGIADASLYYTFNAIALVATRLAFGRFADRFKPVFTTAPALIVAAIGYSFLLIAGSAPVLFPFAGILIGMGTGMASPTLNAIVIKNAGPARRGAASATYMMSFDIGIGAGSFVWGLFIDTLGFSAVFGGCIVCMLVACVLSCIWLREKK